MRVGCDSPEEHSPRHGRCPIGSKVTRTTGPECPFPPPADSGRLGGRLGLHDGSVVGGGRGELRDETPPGLLEKRLRSGAADCGAVAGCGGEVVGDRLTALDELGLVVEGVERVGEGSVVVRDAA